MKRLALSVVSILLFACASAGVNVNQDQLRAFKIGETTTSEVIGKLGAPTFTELSNDGTKTLIYSYSHAQVRPATFIPYLGMLVGGSDIKTSTVALRFGPDGKLISYSSAAGNIGSGIGFASGSPKVRTDQPRTVTEP